MTIEARKGSLAVLMLAAAAMGQAQGISVTVDNRPVQFANVGPTYMNGRVLVPLRGVFEEMGAYVDWNAATRTVLASKANTDVRLRIGDRFATVNGMQQPLDVPATIYRGSTMVPLRFISEALGADVQWVAANREVVVSTGIAGNMTGNRTNTTRSGLRRAVVARLAANTVIPVTLDQTLSSRNNQKGDTFTATIVTDDSDNYAGLPVGTKIEGVVQTARPKSGNDPGILELDFRRVRLPDGTSRALQGSLTNLDSSNISRNSEGVLTARGDSRDDRLVYAGYGAAGGLLVGLLTKKPLEGAILGGVLGYLYGQVRRDQQANDVTLRPGTQLGVRLDQALVLRER